MPSTSYFSLDSSCGLSLWRNSLSSSLLVCLVWNHLSKQRILKLIRFVVADFARYYYSLPFFLHSFCSIIFIFLISLLYAFLADISAVRCYRQIFFSCYSTELNGCAHIQISLDDADERHRHRTRCRALSKQIVWFSNLIIPLHTRLC